jgi:hypothetical protein
MLILLAASSSEAVAVEPTPKAWQCPFSKDFGNLCVGYEPDALVISERNSALAMTKITTKRKKDNLVLHVYEAGPLNSFHKPGIGTERIRIPDYVTRVFLAPKTLIWSRFAEAPDPD